MMLGIKKDHGISIFHIYGPSCSGKSSLCQALKETFQEQAIYIDRDDLLEKEKIEESEVDKEIDRRIDRLKRSYFLLIDAQIPWRQKKEEEIYIALLPPIEVLRFRNQIRNERMGRSEKRAFYALQFVEETFEKISTLPSETFDHSFDSSILSSREIASYILQNNANNTNDQK